MNRVMLVAPLAILVCVAAGTASVAQAAGACTQSVGCTEVRTFTATVTNLRASKQGANRVVSLTVRFQNKTDKPLTLGYVSDSGLILDEAGNRYVVPGAGAVRGIGSVTGNTFDAKFTLEPKEGSDARFELLWANAGNAAAGAKFDLDLAVREIVPASGDQMKLGAEHALHYAAIDEATLAAAAKGSPAPAAPAAAAAGAVAAAPAGPTDPCAGAQSCFNAGQFVAQVQQVTPSQYTPAGKHHTIKLNVRFTNPGKTPIVLVYKPNTSAIIDNLGNKYGWKKPGVVYDVSAQGIGTITGKGTDAQFVLNPGQSRAASWEVWRGYVDSPIGNVFQYDVVINEVEVLVNQQVRTVRENSLNFMNLVAGNYNTATAPGVAQLPGQAAGQVPGTPATGEADVANKVIDLFNSISKKKEKTP